MLGNIRYQLVKVNQQRVEVIVKEYLGYKILEDGTVLSKRTGLPFKWSDNGKGYLISALHVDGVRIPVSQHIIVAHAYHGDCPDGYEVGHIDGVRDNNHPSNLKYMTKSENNKQSWTDGNRDATGVNNANCKYSEIQIHEICTRLEKCPLYNVSKMSRETGIPRGVISNIKHRKQWGNISASYKF